jgi:hypothetical protein
MRALSTAEFLTVWELGINQSSAQRALTLLASSSDETPLDRLAQLSIGQCDARLLTLRERTFGSRLAAVSSCPACDEALEFEINVSDIRVASASEPGEPMEMECLGYDVRFRLPNNVDISSLDPDANVETNRHRLFSRCLLSARYAGEAITADELPTQIIATIAGRMAEADPQADIQLSLACPQCSHQWNASLDIASFFWSEVNARALRLLNDVHLLASAYGWREADILSMSSARRQAYLELAGNE